MAQRKRGSPAEGQDNQVYGAAEARKSSGRTIIPGKKGINVSSTTHALMARNVEERLEGKSVADSTD